MGPSDAKRARAAERMRRVRAADPDGARARWLLDTHAYRARQRAQREAERAARPTPPAPTPPSPADLARLEVALAAPKRLGRPGYDVTLREWVRRARQ